MDEAVSALMSIPESPRGLDGDIQEAPANLFFCPLIQRAVPNPVFQTASIHPLGKDGRNSADLAHVITGDNIRMKAQIDPVFRFGNKFLFSSFTALRKESRLGTLHGKVRIPAVVVHLPDASHSSLYGIGDHLVGSEKRVPFQNSFPGNGILFIADPAVRLIRHSGEFHHAVFTETHGDAETLVCAVAGIRRLRLRNFGLFRFRCLVLFRHPVLLRHLFPRLRRLLN